MTLTLEDVKNVRFPIAKRVGEGYRATEVDDFVDRVDASFASMLEENERLKAQLEALDGAAPVDDAAADGDRLQELGDENARLKAELDEARQGAATTPATSDAAGSDELARLRAENEQLRAQADELRQQVEAARQATPLAVVDGQGGGRVEKIVVTTAAQASPAVTRLVQLATEQAESVVAEARANADRTVQEAEAKATSLTADATSRAERIESEARLAADRLNQQARANSDSVNADAEKRRQEMFGALEAERDQLLGRVNGLRTFESNYRDNLVKHFQDQLDAVRKVDVEPAEKPELLAGQATSPTPRLDALLAEGRSAH